jgi:hypothetical protein
MSATKPPPGYDDRFVVPLEPSRRGAHRARVGPLIGVLPVAAVVAVVSVVIVLAWTLFGGEAPGSGAASGGGVTSAATPGGSGPAAAGSGTAPSSQTTPAATSSAGSETRPGVNQTAAVTVLNATGRSGLGAKVAGLLVGKGWTGAKVAKTSTATRPTTVFYATTEQKAEAEALVADLGVGVTKKSTTMGTGITVVLGSDYPTNG